MICVAGKNEIAINATKYLLKELCIPTNYIIGLVNKTDFGKDNWQPSFLNFCNNNNIRITTIDKLYDLSELIFLSLEFDKIIKPNKFKSENLFNIHFSLLPTYKGMYTSIWPILNGEEKSGVTLHRIDEGIDTGDIIDQTEFEIGINFTSRDLYFEYLRNAFCLLKNNIAKILDNKINTKKQSKIGSYYSKDSINFSKISINLKKTSFEIHNQIRAYIFKEYQLPRILNENIIKSELCEDIIDKNRFERTETGFIISGVDGYKIKLTTNE